MAITVKKP